MSRIKNSKYAGVDKSLYDRWQGMRSRCYNPNSHKYSKYGARGIKVCDRWKDSYVNYVTDMGTPPSPKHSVNRIDNDGDYSPENCRWATWEEQLNNTSRNILVSYKGRTQTLSQWSRESGVNDSTLSWRINKGWPLEKALKP